MIVHFRIPAAFFIGQLVATPNALATFPEEFLEASLNRHVNCDWGDLDEEDRHANDEALARGGRLFSVYVMPDREKLWIITEADRSIRQTHDDHHGFLGATGIHLDFHFLGIDSTQCG